MAYAASSPSPSSASSLFFASPGTSGARFCTMESARLSSGSSQRHGRRHSHVPTISSLDSMAAPPSYPSGRRRSGRRHSHQTLPGYGQAVALDFQRSQGLDNQHGGVARQQNEFYVRSGSGSDSRIWATLRIDSRASSTPTSGAASKPPKYCGGDTITGVISLDLEKPMTINSINLSLRGRYVTGWLEDGGFMFLNQVTPIWDKNAGDPRMPHPSPLEFDGSKKTKFNAKLEGSYAWAFSVHIPTEIILPSRSGSTQNFVQTPQSFLERFVAANVQYHLVMHITHGLFKANSKLQVDIHYEPSLSPPPASFLRQQAYLQGGFLLPPSEDPTGWHTLPTQSISRSVGNAQANLTMTLSIACPLSYTRGTTIPCFLVLNTDIPSEDIASLLMSAKGPAFELKLQRKISHASDASVVAAVISGSKSLVMKDSETWLAKATWWKPASHDTLQTYTTCFLEGEIHLPPEITPSCQATFFAVDYNLVLVKNSQTIDQVPTPAVGSSSRAAHPSRPSVSTPSSRSSSAGPVEIIECPVTIATFHVHGPLPTPFTTPPKTQRKDRDIDVVTGIHSGRGKKSGRGSIAPENVFGQYSLRAGF